MKKRYFLVLSFSLIFSFNYCFAQFSKTGTAAAQFLKIGVGARAMGLGGAFGSLANDVSALYWNPAGLVMVDNLTMMGSYSPWIADIAHHFAGFSVPLSQNDFIGLSAIFLTMDDMEITTIDRPHGTGEFFGASDFAIGLSYARRLTDRFSVGFTGKYIGQKIYNEEATGLAFDIGTRLRTGFHGLIISMNFSNIGNRMQLKGIDLLRPYDPNPGSSNNPFIDATLNTELWALPTNFRISVCMNIVGEGPSVFSSDDNLLTLIVDGNHPTDGEEKASFGIEYQWQELFALRFGYMLNYDDESLAFGLGFKPSWGGKILAVDLAYIPSDLLNDIQIFSLSLQL
jgi:hypothetical protein